MLHNTIEQMNKAFLQFNDEAMTSGLMQQRPELARLLKSTTEQFIQLTKAAGQATGDQLDSEADDDGQTPELTNSRPVPLTQHDANWLVDPMRKARSGPSTRPRTESMELPLGYVRVMDESSDSVTAPAADSGPDADAQTELMSTTAASYEPVYTLPLTSSGVLDKILPTHDWSEQQQYGAKVTEPTQPNMPLPSPQKFATLTPQYTYSFQETTLARRLQRATLERSFHLLSQAHIRPAAFTRVFRLSLLYQTRDQLLQKFRHHLTSSTMKPLETFSMPFFHLGGAGTHYQNGRIQNGYIIKQGPMMQRARIEPADHSDVGYDVDIDLKEYEGEWFDANDVEGYLQEHGVTVAPQSSFTEAELSTDLIPPSAYETSGVDPPVVNPLTPISLPDTISPGDNASRTNSYSSTGPDTPPPPPVLSEAALELGANRLFPELMGLENMASTTLDNTATGWLFGSGDKTPDFLSSGWADVQAPSQWDATDSLNAISGFAGWNLAELPMPAVAVVPLVQQQPQLPKKRSVTIDVNKLIDGECLALIPCLRA